MWPILWGPIDISGTAEARVVEFCTQVDYQILPFGWQTGPKRAWSESYDPFSVSMPTVIPPERLKWESPNFIYWYRIYQVLALGWQTTPNDTLLMLHLWWKYFENRFCLFCLFCLYCCYIIYCMLPLEVNKVVQKYSGTFYWTRCIVFKVYSQRR